MRVFKAISKSIVTYYNKTWLLPSNIKSKIQAIEINSRGGVNRITRRTRIRNMNIPEQLEHIIEKKKQISWLGHLHGRYLKKPNNRSHKKVQKVSIRIFKKYLSIYNMVLYFLFSYFYTRCFSLELLNSRRNNFKKKCI